MSCLPYAQTKNADGSVTSYMFGGYYAIREPGNLEPVPLKCLNTDKPMGKCGCGHCDG